MGLTTRWTMCQRTAHFSLESLASPPSPPSTPLTHAGSGQQNKDAAKALASTSFCATKRIALPLCHQAHSGNLGHGGSCVMALSLPASYANRRGMQLEEK